MSKKYKLVIPVHYREVLAAYFLEYDGMTVIPTKNDNEFAVYPGSSAHLTLIDIPIELQPALLQEIKKPVVLSAEEYYQIVCNNPGMWGSNKVEKAFSEGDKNGQLREWQRKEQVELREAAEAYRECSNGPRITRLFKAIKNLKPPHERQL